MRLPLVHVHDIAFAFLLVSGLISMVLVGYAILAYRRSRNPSLAFVMGAFIVFSLKSLGVAYALYTGSVEHELLELFDAVGDMGTILLLFLPILWRPRPQP